MTERDRITVGEREKKREGVGQSEREREREKLGNSSKRERWPLQGSWRSKKFGKKFEKIN